MRADLRFASRQLGIPTHASVERAAQAYQTKRHHDHSEGDGVALDVAFAVYRRAAIRRFRHVQRSASAESCAPDAGRGRLELRPTDGGTSYRVMQHGRLRFVFVRHPENENLLYATDSEGRPVRVNGVLFWREHAKGLRPAE